MAGLLGQAAGLTAQPRLGRTLLAAVVARWRSLVPGVAGPRGEGMRRCKFFGNLFDTGAGLAV